MYIAIDIGGTNVRIAGSKSLDDIVFENIQRFQLTHDFEKDFQKIVEIIKNVSDNNIEAIGIGIPGIYDYNENQIIVAKNIPEWVNVPFVEKFSELFNCPVFADNDAAASALGEAVYGKNFVENFLYVIWGTGIGGAQVYLCDGIVKSRQVDWFKYFEEIDKKCSGRIISQAFCKNIEDMDDNCWQQIFENFIFDLSAICEKLELKKVVLGGGVVINQKDRLQKFFNKITNSNIDVKLSNFNDDIGLYGALALIKSKE